MTVSRTDKIRLSDPVRVALRSAALVGVLLMPSLASAQQTPFRLGPFQAAPEGQSEPAPARPDGEPASPPAAGPLSPSSYEESSNIQVDTLQTIDPDSAGTLTLEEGGLPADLWQGSDWGLVKGLVEGLPVNTPSPVVRDLMRRVLLTAGTPPAGKRQPGTFMTLRMKQLIAMGELTGAADLLSVMPGRESDEELARIEADTRFLLNDNARACSITAQQIGRSDSIYWQKAFVFCAALAGDKEKALLGVDLIRELDPSDVAFAKLGPAVSGIKTAALDSLADPSPLHLAMARVAKAELPQDVLASGNPAILRAVATNPYAPIEVRLEAAERAEGVGALPIDALRQIYTSVSFTKEELANPLSKAEGKSGAVGRALLYRTALVQTVPTAKAEAIARALELGRESGRYTATVEAFLPILSDVPPAAELAWFAPVASRALLVADDPERAEGWLQQLRADAMFQEGSRAEVVRLLPLARISGGPGTPDWSPERLREWWAATKGDAAAASRATLLYALLEGLNERIPGELWADLLQNPVRTPLSMPHPVLWDRLNAASDGRRAGETVLLAVSCLGAGSLAEVNPIVLRRVMASLAAVGLVDEGRDLALEAAVTAGL